MNRDSPTRRVRVLADAGARESVAHVGLAHEKLAPHNTAADREAQARFIRNLVGFSTVPPGYELWFRRWVRRTPVESERPFGRRVRVAVSQGRVLCGLGGLTPTENGLAIHPTYGVPYLPGSSLKGIARAWLDENVSEGPWARGGPLYREVFGAPAGGEDDEDDLEAVAAGEDKDPGLSGTVAFLDALWIAGDPRLPAKPWAAEILTPHLGRYYRGDGPPDGTESPIPVTFLAAQGGFRLVVEGPKALLDPTMELLERALLERGVGAKGRSGYGRFRLWVADALTREDGFEASEREDRERRRDRAEAIAGAGTAAGMFEALRRFEPGFSARAALVAWFTGGESQDPRLMAFPVTPEAAREVVVWAHVNDESKGLLKRVRDQLPPDVVAALEEAGQVDSPGPFGTNTIEVFDDPTGLSRKQASRWPNDFAGRIAGGWCDEDTVRRAIAHLRAHGGRDGHVSIITRAYGITE